MTSRARYRPGPTARASIRRRAAALPERKTAAERAEWKSTQEFGRRIRGLTATTNTAAMLDMQVLYQDPLAGPAAREPICKNLCWAAALASAVNYYRRRGAAPQTVVGIAQQYLRTKDKYDVPADLGHALRAFGLREAFLGERPNDPETLLGIVRHINRGHPVIVQLHKRSTRNTHFIFIVGYRQKSQGRLELAVKDPSGAKATHRMNIKFVPDTVAWKPPFAKYEGYTAIVVAAVRK